MPTARKSTLKDAGVSEVNLSLKWKIGLIMEDGNFSQNAGGKEGAMNAKQKIYGTPDRDYSSAYHLPPFELCVEMSKKGNV